MKRYVWLLVAKMSNGPQIVMITKVRSEAEGMKHHFPDSEVKRGRVEVLDITE